MKVALALGREAVIESFNHAKTLDDTYLAEARLRDIDAALTSEVVVVPKEAYRKMVEALHSHCDAGVSDEGWKSPELILIISEAEKLLNE